MKPFVVFVNGPAYSGKTTAARLIARMRHSCYVTAFATVLKERTHALYGFPQASAEGWEGTKDRPSDAFLGLTPRQAYIEVSERYFKQIHGADIFGKLLLLDINRNVSRFDPPIRLVVVGDSGFAAEAEPVIRAFGPDRCGLIRLHRDSCTFDGDSRSYWQRDGVRDAEVTNNGSLSDLSVVLQGTLNSWGFLS